MTTRKAAQKFAILSATGVSALLLLGSALASTDIQAPCPELASHTESSLHDVLDEDEVTTPAIRTIDSSEKQEKVSKTTETSIPNTEVPDVATRLPGVSSSDLPRFRRHMFRTDI